MHSFLFGTKVDSSNIINHKIKHTAVRETAEQLFGPGEVHVEGKEVYSNVNVQPFGHHQTLLGASNRMKHLKEIIGQTHYDLLITIENGIYLVSAPGMEKCFDLAWVIAESEDGEQATAHSAGIEIVDTTAYLDSLRSCFSKTIGQLLGKSHSLREKYNEAY